MGKIEGEKKVLSGDPTVRTMRIEKAGSKAGCSRGKGQAVTAVGSLKLEGRGLQGSLVGNLKAETQ